jgi:hypothetical protein
MMKRMILTALALLGAFAVQAGQVDLTCDLPTVNADGTPLTDLAGIRLHESQTAGGPYVQVAESPSCNFTLDRPAGTYYYVATAYTTANVESVSYSNEAIKTLASSSPAPPSNLVATGDLVAYGSQQTDEVQTVYPVGSVPDGTPCDSSMSANGKYRVNKSAVIWVGSVRPAVVFAECGAG